MTSQKLFVSGMTAILGLSLAFPAFAEETAVDGRPKTRLEHRLIKGQESGTTSQSRGGERKVKGMNEDGESDRKEREKTRGSSSTVDTACVSAAIDVRDTAIMGAMDTMSSSLKSALSTRKSALMTAWSGTDATERNTVIRTIWSDFMTSTKAARNEMKTAKRTIWSTFKTSLKGCKASGVDTSGESSESSL